MLDTFVMARLTLQSSNALVAPRDAVLSADAGAYQLFTVKDGKAVKQIVQIGIENDEESEVSGKEIAEGDSVAVVGNYILEDGMAVQTYAAPVPLTASDKQPSADIINSPATRPADSVAPASEPATTQSGATQPATAPASPQEDRS